jgi:hypothetical protein
VYDGPIRVAGILGVMRAGALRGQEHTGIGRLACLSEGAAALALSRGGAPKRYAYADPNEDATGFALGPGGALLALADGHSGHQASEQAVGELLARAAGWLAEAPSEEPWEHAAARTVAEVHDAIRARGARGGNPASRTTLCFALIRPAEDVWAWASVGDSHVFRLSADPAVECGPHSGKNAFLGSPSRESDELGLRSGHEPLVAVQGVALASDGLSERGIGVADPPAAVAEAAAAGTAHAPHLRPLETARALAEIAMASHRRQDAGDNIACAVWIRP